MISKIRFYSVVRSLLITIFYLFCGFISFFVITVFVINRSEIKNKISNYVLTSFNKKYNTNIRWKFFDIDYFGRINVNELIVKDHHDLDFIHFKSMKLSLAIIPLIKNNLHIVKFRSIIIEEPNIKIITYKNEQISNLFRFINKFQDKELSKATKFKFLAQTTVLNGKFGIINKNFRDSIYLNAKNLNFSLDEMQIDEDSTLLKINKFSFNTIKNSKLYRLKEFSTSLYYSKKRIIFDKFMLKTDSSLLIGSLNLSYTSPSDFSDFANKIILNINLFPNSILSSIDINYFLDKWNSKANYMVFAQISGNFNNLHLKNFNLVCQNNRLFSQSIQLKNIINSNYSINLNNLSLETSKQNLKSILPGFISKQINRYIKSFKTINYKGDFFINTKQITTQGNIISNLGNANLNIQIKEYSKKNSSYTGTIRTSYFLISELIKNPVVKNFSGEINFSGSGFDSKNLHLDVHALLLKIHLFDYSLINQKFNGMIKNQILSGFLTSDDPLLNFSTHITADFSSSKYKINCDGEIKSFDLHAYNLSKMKGEFISSKFMGNATFNSMKDLEADVRVKNFILNSPVNSMTFKNLELRTYQSQYGRFLNLNSSNIHFTVDGRYNLADLSNIFINGIGSMIIGYKERKIEKNSNFNFNLEIKDNFLELFVKDISFQNGVKLQGSYKSQNHYFDLFLTSPKISYQNIAAENLIINLITSDQKKKLSFNSDVFSMKNQFIRHFDVQANKNNDTVLIQTKFFIDKKLSKPFNINLYQTYNHNKMFFGILSSTFNINDHQWIINKNNNLIEVNGIYDLKTGEISFRNIFLHSEDAEIIINGVYKSINDIEALVKFKKVKLENFIPQEQLGEITLGGTADGMIDFKKIGCDFIPISDFLIKNIKINNILLGDIQSRVNLNNFNKTLIVETKITNKSFEVLTLNGSIDNIFKNPQLNLKTKISDLNASILEGILNGVVSNMKGKINGNLDIYGDLKNPSYKGNFSIDDFSFKVDYLGVTYQFDKVKDINVYSLDQNPKNLGNIYIKPTSFYMKDRKIKRTGSVFGIIQTSGLDKWYLNLDFESDNLMVLNTTPKQNELLFGKIFARGTFNIHGTIDNLILSADAQALEGSKLSLNTSYKSSVEDESKILVFKKPIMIEQDKIIPTSLGLLSMDFRISVDDKTEIKVILNEITRDEIIARGKSSDQIRLRIFSNGDVKMDGRYEVKYGSRYHFRTLLDKEFIIQNGSTLVWNGSPYDADLNIIAFQTKQVSNAGDFLQMSNIPIIPVDLKVFITNKISEPKINFKIEAPYSPQRVKEELQSQFESNPDSERNQFGVILLTGKFLTENSGATGFQNSAYEVAIRQLINFLNNISSDVQFNLGVSESDALSQTTRKLNSEVKINFTHRVKVKSSVGVPFGTNISSINNQLTAEGEIELDVSKRNDNSLIIRGFSRPTSFGLENLNIGFTHLQSYGIGFIYRKSFNKLMEFLGVNKN